MTKSIEPLEVKFDADRLLTSLPDVITTEEFREGGQLAISHALNDSSWFSGVGSLYDYQEQTFTKQTSDYIHLNAYFKDSYMEAVIHEVRELALREKRRIGRVRLMLLKPKTCYSLHQDLEEFRYHIPLQTNQKNFFVSGDKVEYMPECGRLYKFYTRDFHTAVNASFENRMHLVFDTFIEPTAEGLRDD